MMAKLHAESTALSGAAHPQPAPEPPLFEELTRLDVSLEWLSDSQHTAIFNAMNPAADSFLERRLMSRAQLGHGQRTPLWFLARQSITSTTLILLVR
jgi:hypothetical protein